MFNEIARKINEIIGTDFAVFSFFDPNSEETMEMLEVFQPAILSVETGTLRPLEGFEGLEADCLLTLMVEVKDEEKNAGRIEEVLNNLIAHSNGIITDVQGRGNKEYKYVFNYGAPKYQDYITLEVNGVSKRYAVMSLGISVVVTADLVFGNSGSVTIDGNECAGLLRYDFRYGKGIEPVQRLNSVSEKGQFINKSWACSLTILISWNAFYLKVLNDYKSQENVTYTFRFELFDFIDERRVNIEEIRMSGVKGQFIELTLSLSEAL